MSEELFTQMQLPVNGGRSVPLGALANLRTVDSPVKVEHENAARTADVRANVRELDLIDFVNEADQVAQNVSLPDGHRLSWGGQLKTSSVQQPGWR